MDDTVFDEVDIVDVVSKVGACAKEIGIDEKIVDIRLFRCTVASISLWRILSSTRSI